MAQAETEHSPLSGWDEYPIHQIAAPLRIVETTDLRAYERYWFAVHDRRGEFMLAIGMGFYPNLGTVDAFVALNHDHKQHAIRAHRHLRDSRSDISCGPFRFEVVEPFREWRLRLDDSGHGMTFDFRFRDTKRALFQTFGLPPATDHRQLRICGYETFGVAEGFVSIDGTRLDLDPAFAIGSRDHHWGERKGVGGIGFKPDAHRETHFGQFVEFSDWGFWANRILYNLGDSRGGAVALAHSEYELEFDPETDHFIGGVVDNTFVDGQRKIISYRLIGDKVNYLRTGLYAGPDNRGSPDGNIYHGVDVGDGVVHRDTYDLTNPRTRIRLGGFENHLVRATCDGEETVGLMEIKNPVAYEWTLAGRPGFRFTDREKARLGL